MLFGPCCLALDRQVFIFHKTKRLTLWLECDEMGHWHESQNLGTRLGLAFVRGATPSTSDQCYTIHLTFQKLSPAFTAFKDKHFERASYNNQSQQPTTSHHGRNL